MGSYQDVIPLADGPSLFFEIDGNLNECNSGTQTVLGMVIAPYISGDEESDYLSTMLISSGVLTCTNS